MKERLENTRVKIKDLHSLISAWEEGFLESLAKQVDKGKSLSVKQLDVLHRIESKVEKLSKGDPEWKEGWNADKEWQFKTAVTYYKASVEGYFRQILQWVASNPDTIPPRSYYQKLVENKYAQKIITNLKKDPKYAAGSTVMLRANARQGVSYQVMEKFRNVPLFVVAPTGRAVSAANGCRIYSVLSSVSADSFEIEERWIKKWNKKSISKNSSVSEILF